MEYIKGKWLSQKCRVGPRACSFGLSILSHPPLPTYQCSVVWYSWAHSRQHLDYYDCGKLFPAKPNGTLKCYPAPHLITGVFSGGNAVLSVVDMLSISHHCLEIERRAQKSTGTSSACEASSQLLTWLVPALCQDPFPSLHPWILHCLVSHTCWSLSLCWDASFGPYCQWEGLGWKSFFLRSLKPRLCFLQMVRAAVERSDVWNPFLSFFFFLSLNLLSSCPVFWNFSAMHYDGNLFSCIVQNIPLV